MQFELTRREINFAVLLGSIPYELTEADVIAAGRSALGWRCDVDSEQRYLVKQLANDPRIIEIRDRDRETLS